MKLKLKINYIKCSICNRIFYCPTWRQIKYHANFCSTKCYWVSKKGIKLSKEHKAKIKKANIGKIRSKESRERYSLAKIGHKVSIATRKKISLHHANFKGSNHPQWKGGRKHRTDGSISIYSPLHPYAHKRGKHVLEHRLITEKILKRFLKPTEIIHHINHIRNDNRPKNLYLFNTNKEHLDYHRFGIKNKLQLITKSNLINGADGGK